MGTRFAGLYKFQGVDVNSVEAMEHLRQWDLRGGIGMDSQLSTDSIRIEVTGNHFMTATLSFQGEANVTYFAEIRQNGLRIAGGFMAAQEVTVADKPFNMSIIGAFLLKEGDLISVYVGSDEGGGANFQLVYGQFGVMSL